MSYKALEIYQDLPQTNCGDCDKPGCFQFGLAVYLNQLELDACPHIKGEQLAGMQEKLLASRDAGDTKAPPNHEQALTRLLEVMDEADMKEMAKLAGCKYVAENPESIEVHLFGEPFIVERNIIHQPKDHEENVWEKVLLLLYLSMSKGNLADGRWVAFRELPNTISKAKNFEDECERLAKVCTFAPEKLDRIALDFGGVIVESEPLKRTYEFQALPRVKIRLIYWVADHEFPARCSILLDRGVLDYLDQEASVFLAEVFVNKTIEAIEKNNNAG